MTESNYPDRNVPVPSNAAGSRALQSERMLLVREANPNNNLRDYLSIFFKHKGGIIASFLALSVIGVALVFIYMHFYTPRYEAMSSILVKFGWENYSPDLSPGSRGTPAISQGDMLGSEVSILQSRELKEQVISALKPETIFPELAGADYKGANKHDAALVLLDKYLAIRPESRSNVIDVAFDGANPESAAAVVNQLVAYYIDRRAEIYKDPKSVLFLQNKVDYYQQKMAEAQNNLKSFSEQTDIISFDQQRNMLLARRSDLIVALNAASNNIKGTQQKITELQKELHSIPKAELNAAANRSGDVQSRLLGLKLQEQSLMSKYKDNSPLIADVRTQIAMVQQYQKQNSANNPGVASADPIYQDVQKQILDNRAQLSALNAGYDGTQKQLAKLNAELQTFQAHENQYTALAGAVASDKQIYLDYRRRLEQAKVYNELGRDKMTSVSVIEPAGVPIVPVNQPKPLILMLAAVIGVAFVGSLGIAYILELNKQVLSTAMEAEKRLDLPVLVTVPVRN